MAARERMLASLPLDEEFAHGVVVLRLSDARRAAPDSPWGRISVGWDPALTDEELRSVNRGIWNPGAR